MSPALYVMYSLLSSRRRKERGRVGETKQNALLWDFFCVSFFVIQGEMVGGKKLSDGFVSYLQLSLSGVSFVGHSKG